ncbi:MAG TPA: hypothetical protein DCQ99_04620 [Nitrospinae bacterium]|nr:hypothetical protein [Nitrospinota bacterium]HBA27424.1 hypothetical protein [Nitrospinota bacterium]
MPKPSYLIKLKEIAKNNLEKEPEVAFMVSWILWEAIRSRLLLLQCKKRGWSLKDAGEVIALKKISNNENFKKAFKSIVGINFLEAVSTHCKNNWHILTEIEEIRHRIFHGGVSISPKDLACITQFILNYIDGLKSNQEDKNDLGDPFKREKKTKISKNKDELLYLLVVNKKEQKELSETLKSIRERICKT